jgi:hypothetical protein
MALADVGRQPLGDLEVDRARAIALDLLVQTSRRTS